MSNLTPNLTIYSVLTLLCDYIITNPLTVLMIGSFLFFLYWLLYPIIKAASTNISGTDHVSERTYIDPNDGSTHPDNIMLNEQPSFTKEGKYVVYLCEFSPVKSVV